MRAGGGAWYNRLPYLAPMVLTLIPTLAAFRWPIAGGAMIMLLGLFALFFFGNAVALIGLAVALIGVAFVVDGILRRRAPADATASRSPWWRRRWRSLFALGASLTVITIVSASRLPVVLTRVDDGDRGARRVDGNAVELIWAPEGPGWNWRQAWGGYPSWQHIALYGVPPVGLGDKAGYGRQGEGEDHTVYATAQDMAQTNLCRYLSAEGTALLDEPPDIWRMPTTDEVVRSLGRHGVNAGCRWQGEFGEPVKCAVLPDKESPLWATDQPVIYYWTADSYSEAQGYFAAYNGTVFAENKLAGNPRHSHRCVREP